MKECFMLKFFDISKDFATMVIWNVFKSIKKKRSLETAIFNCIYTSGHKWPLFAVSPQMSIIKLCGIKQKQTRSWLVASAEPLMSPVVLSWLLIKTKTKKEQTAAFSFFFYFFLFLFYWLLNALGHVLLIVIFEM